MKIKPKKTTVFLWGDLCIDENNLDGQEVYGPGGSSFFCAKIFTNLGWHPVIISPRGIDYNTTWLQNTSVYPQEPVTKHTLVYQNCYDSKGRRTLYARNRDCASFINPLSIPDDEFSKAQAVVVCPIDSNVSHSHIRDLRAKMGNKKLLACLPQGFFRRYESSGKVYQSEWQDAKKIIPFLDFVFLSEEDGEDLDKKAVYWNTLGAQVIITRAERGCSIFQNGKRTDFPAFPVQEIIDPVGAGDVFSAAFIYSYLLSDKDIKKAAVFANATAALSLSFHAQEINIDIEKIKRFLSSFRA